MRTHPEIGLMTARLCRSYARFPPRLGIFFTSSPGPDHDLGIRPIGRASLTVTVMIHF